MPREHTHHNHVSVERAELFTAQNAGATEEEYLHLLTSLVLCLKPKVVMETGAWTGQGTAAIAEGLRCNGFGSVTSIEMNRRACDQSRSYVDARGLSSYVNIVCDESMRFIRNSSSPVDFAFFDSHLPIRPDEAKLCIQRGILKSGSVCAFHDSSRLRTIPSGHPGRIDGDGMEFWRKIEAMGDLLSDRFEFPLSRGLLLVRIR